MINTTIKQFQSLSLFVLISAAQFCQVVRDLSLDSVRSLGLWLPLSAVNLLSAMVFGQKQNVPITTKPFFEITGMQHVAVASGSNVALMLSPLILLSHRFQWSRQARSLGALLIISWYLILVGWEAPIVRASLMIGYSLVGQLFDRQYRPGLGLMWAAAILVVTQPSWLASLSFQLSVLATWAVIAVVPLLHQPGFLSHLESADLLDFSVTPNSNSWMSVWISRGARVIKEGSVMSLGVQLVVSPLLLWQFGKLPLLSLLANGTLGWITTLIGWSGLALFLAQVVLGWCSPVMLVLAVPTRLFTDFFLIGLAVFGRFPATVINWHLPFWQLALWYVGLGGWFLWRKQVIVRTRQKGVTWEELVN